MEYKYIDLLSCSFEASDDVYVRQQVRAGAKAGSSRPGEHTGACPGALPRDRTTLLQEYRGCRLAARTSRRSAGATTQ